MQQKEHHDTKICNSLPEIYKYFTQPMFPTHRYAEMNLVLNSDSLTHDAHAIKI